MIAFALTNLGLPTLLLVLDHIHIIPFTPVPNPIFFITQYNYAHVHVLTYNVHMHTHPPLHKYPHSTPHALFSLEYVYI